MTASFTPRRAFTLIELLVTIAVIAIFIGGFGLAFNSDNIGTKLGAASAQTSSLLTTARSLAISKGTRSRLAINLDPGDRGYLREMVVIYEDPDEADVWILGSNIVELSRGAYFVPEEIPDTTSGVSWSGDFISVFDPDSPETSNNFPFDGASEYAYVEFNSRGTIDLRTDKWPQRILLSGGQVGPTGEGVEFTNPNSTVGLILRIYGSHVSIDDPAAFSQTLSTE